MVEKEEILSKKNLQNVIKSPPLEKNLHHGNFLLMNKKLILRNSKVFNPKLYSSKKSNVVIVRSSSRRLLSKQGSRLPFSAISSAARVPINTDYNLSSRPQSNKRLGFDTATSTANEFKSSGIKKLPPPPSGCTVLVNSQFSAYPRGYVPHPAMVIAPVGITIILIAVIAAFRYFQKNEKMEYDNTNPNIEEDLSLNESDNP